VLSGENVQAKLEKYRVWLLAAGLACMALEILWWFDIAILPIPQIWYDIFSRVYGWVMILALMGVGRRHLDADGKFAQYMSRSSFSVYLFHQTEPAGADGAHPANQRGGNLRELRDMQEDTGGEGAVWDQEIEGIAMTIAVFLGSPRKGNTYRATKIFLDELQKCGEVRLIEFQLPGALPGFCTGCTLCLGGQREKCPDAQYVTPIAEALMEADALVFATPHYGACSMPGAMKNLLDHLAFLEMNVAPRAEMFGKKAFVLTTGAGSAAAVKPIGTFLRHWGVNRVYARGFRMFTDRWSNMPEKKQARYEAALRRAARKFYGTPRRRPYLSSIAHYHMTKFILKRYVGEGSYPYEYWKERGWFRRRPF